MHISQSSYMYTPMKAYAIEYRFICAYLECVCADTLIELMCVLKMCARMCSYHPTSNRGQRRVIECMQSANWMYI